MNYLFDKNWFKKYQKQLLWLLNMPIFKIWFRWVMRIRKYDCKEKIIEITPNSFSWKQNNFITTDFRTHNKYLKRLYYAFYPIWYAFHSWDMIVNFLRLPALNLGFDTLVVYPDVGSGFTTVDGRVYRLTTGTWSEVRDGVGEGSETTSVDTYPVATQATGILNHIDFLNRGIYLFDTSLLPDNAIINNAIFSVYGTAYADTGMGFGGVGIVSSNPAANNELVSSDYSTLGTTRYTPDITLLNWDVSIYNDFTFNATGITNISKTGITKLGMRFDLDIDNTTPTWTSYDVVNVKGYFADQTGTSQDPKLVITYNLGGAGSNPTLLTMNVG